MKIKIEGEIDVSNIEDVGKAIAPIYHEVIRELTTMQPVPLPGMPAPIPTVKVRYPEPEVDDGKV